MPIIKSAKKRARTARLATIRNRRDKRVLKDAIKQLDKALAGDKKNAAKLYAAAQGELDKAVKKNIMHKNKAARVKSHLSAKLKAAGVKPATAAAKPKAASKTPAKKPAKSTTTKKATAKKPAAKKPAAKK